MEVEKSFGRMRNVIILASGLFIVLGTFWHATGVLAAATLGLVLMAVVVNMDVPRSRDRLVLVIKFGGNRARLAGYLAVFVLVLAAFCINFARYQSGDAYARDTAGFVNADIRQFWWMPYACEEDYLNIMVRTDAVNQLEQFLRDPDTGLYEYPVGEDTKYRQLSALCAELNGIMQGLDAEDRDSPDAVQKVFAAVDEIEALNYEQDFNTTAVVLFETGMFMTMLCLLAVVGKWISVNIYVRKNGGREKVLSELQEAG